MVDFFNLESFDFTCFVNKAPESDDQFLLVPNPNDGNFIVYSNASEELIGDIVVTDILGKRVYEEKNVLFESNEIKYFHFSNLPSNTYFFSIQNDDFREVLKFVLVR